MSGPPGLTQRPPTHGEGESDLSGKQDSNGYRTYASIKAALTSMSAEEIDRHLPNLTDTIAHLSAEHAETVRFEVGVSFTEDPKPLDYSIDHVIVSGKDNVLRTISRKDAISEDHFYLAFSYPRDPQFSPKTLRGALLSAIEQQEIVNDTEPSSSTSIVTRISRLIKS